MHGSHLYNIRTEEKIFAWEKETASYLDLDDKALNRCIQAGNTYFCNEAKVVTQGSQQTCLVVVCGGDGARGHGGPCAVPRESKAG
jgi:hypothetical protein